MQLEPTPMHRLLLTAVLLGSVAGCALRPRYSDFISTKTVGPETALLLTTPTGQPLAKVRVEMSESRSRYTATTGADGTFELPVDQKYLAENPVLVVTLPTGHTGYRLTLAPPPAPPPQPAPAPAEPERG
jgi:type IV pilus biogenesis protein CpaD/CtpE